MPDITGMRALPDREQPARESEADGAPSDEFAAMLAAMYLPVVTTPAPGNQPAAPPEAESSASTGVTAVAAPPAVVQASLPETLTLPSAPLSAPVTATESAVIPGSPVVVAPIRSAVQTDEKTQPVAAVRQTGSLSLNSANEPAADQRSPVSLPPAAADESLKQPAGESSPALIRLSSDQSQPEDLSSVARRHDPPPRADRGTPPQAEKLSYVVDRGTVSGRAVVSAEDPVSESRRQAAPALVRQNATPGEAFSELTVRPRQADGSSNNARPDDAHQVQPMPVSRAAPAVTTPIAQPQPVTEVVSRSFGKAKGSEPPKDAEKTDRPAEPSVTDSAPVRERQPALRFEPERGGLIRRVIEETARTQPEQPVAAIVRSAQMNDVRLVSRDPLPLVPVGTETVRSSPAVRIQRQPEPERQKTLHVSAPDEAGPEIAGQNRSLKAALKPLMVELRQPQREAAQSQTDEFSVPESPLPVMLTSHSRAEHLIETTVHAEAQTVIGQTAEPVVSAAVSLAPREARTLSLTLNPQELGRLEVRLTRDDDGRVSASFAVERETTRQALSAGLTELRQTLERAGLPVDRLEIRHAPQSELTGQFPGNPHGQPRQPFHEQPASDRFAALQPSREALNEHPTVTPTVIADRLLSRRA